MRKPTGNVSGFFIQDTRPAKHSAHTAKAENLHATLPRYALKEAGHCATRKRILSMPDLSLSFLRALAANPDFFQAAYGTLAYLRN